MVKLIKQNFKKNAELFNKIKINLQLELGANVPITHVGSTAIPNMSGKNIIDILIGAEDLIEFKQLYKKIEKLGYFPSENSSSDKYHFFATRKEETQAGDTHIHLVLIETDRYNDFIKLKNYLLKYPKEAKSYLKIKKTVIKLSEKDRDEYRRIKGDFVNELIKKARSEID